MLLKPELSGPKARRASFGSFLTLADHSDIRRVERVIAVARVVVAGGALAMRLGPDVSRENDFVSALLIAYCAIGGVLLILTSRHHRTPRHLPVIAQIADISCAVIVSVSAGLAAPFSLSLLFPLLAAAYRRGFRAVMITAAVVDVLLIAAHILFAMWQGLPLAAAANQLKVNAIVTHAMFVAIGGAAIGYLSENERRRRSEAAAVSHVIAQGKSGAGFDETLHQMLTSIHDVFGARRVLLVLHETKTGPLFCWSAGPSVTEPTKAVELPASAQAEYLFAVPGVAWHAAVRRFRRRDRFNVIAIDKLGRRLPAVDLSLPEQLVASHCCHRLVGVALTFGDEWAGRLLIIEPALGIHRDVCARLALRLATHAGHVMQGNYRLQRLRMRAQEIERGRIAHELHDGLTQSLLGLDMQLAALRRRAIAGARYIDEDLARIHGVLRAEIIKLRELMEGTRAGDQTHGSILEEFADMVERFQRYTGISARFESEPLPLDVSTSARRQVARILHEALVNVRKHSNAKRVMVRVVADDGFWQLSVEDDGRGFRFAGRRSHAELDELKQGPRLIGERVRMIGGELNVDSRPGSGSRVEVTIPAHARHD